MNIIGRRLCVKRTSFFPRYFLHVLYGSSNMQFYSPISRTEGLVVFSKARFSSTGSEVNRQSNYYWDEPEQAAADHQASTFTHKSNAQELIHAVPVIEVDGDVARCTGVNEFGFGHPVEYIALNTRDRSRPNVCKW
mmetsp:Transcript_29807/g.34167  ORF Transcript_29807/g.34167 Transcript_29807/m.34167 type:complete len:136 (+) Transcript_29807:2-409(+)